MGHEKSKKKKVRQKQARETLIQRDGKQENEGADEKMERDTDRWGESE